ncbi:hypothetical protein ACFQX6_31525 [Streptosporangium lutulentum]
MRLPLAGDAGGVAGRDEGGGAYLPLDPDYPAERLSFVLRDSGAELLLTEERLRGRLPDNAVPVLLIEDPQAFAGESDVARRRSRRRTTSRT